MLGPRPRPVDTAPQNRDAPLAQTLNMTTSLALVADTHYADLPPSPAGRYYRQSAAKLSAAIDCFNSAGVQLAIHLGDLINSADDAAVDEAALAGILATMRRLHAPWESVIGNHDVEAMPKRRFLELTGHASPHRTRPLGPQLQLVILDAAFTRDGTPYGQGPYHWSDSAVPEAQLHWLEQALRPPSPPTLICAHQRLDADGNLHTIANAADVRRILERSGRVRAVITGHDHTGALNVINHIPYVTLPSMVQGDGLDQTGYSILHVAPRLRLQGFARHARLAEQFNALSV